MGPDYNRDEQSGGFNDTKDEKSEPKMKMKRLRKNMSKSEKVIIRKKKVKKCLLVVDDLKA